MSRANSKRRKVRDSVTFAAIFFRLCLKILCYATLKQFGKLFKIYPASPEALFEPLTLRQKYNRPTHSCRAHCFCGLVRVSFRENITTYAPTLFASTELISCLLANFTN